MVGYGGVVRDESIDLQSAAEQLGVHYQTAYKWVRSGRLPADLVEGRYVLDPGAVETLARRRARPAAPRSRRPRSGFAELSSQLFGYLIAGEESLARKLVSGLVADGVSVTTVMQEVLAPALTRIGDEWHAGRLTIWEEHRASATVERILGEHQPNPRGRRRGTAVVAALSGDRHGIPAAMAAAALREDNWHVHHLGADVPPDELLRFTDQTPVDLVVLTATMPQSVARADRVATRVRAKGLGALVGRPGGSLVELRDLARRK